MAETTDAIPNMDENAPGFVIPLEKMRVLLQSQPDVPFAVAGSREDTPMSAMVYAPLGADDQKPHDRDEIYVIVSGHGIFEYAGKRSAFKTGDLIYVKAFAPHGFVEFSDDFLTWVIFYGAKKTPPTELA